MKAETPSEWIQISAQADHNIAPHLGATNIKGISDVHWLVGILKFLNRLHSQGKLQMPDNPNEQ